MRALWIKVTLNQTVKIPVALFEILCDKMSIAIYL